MSRLGVESAFEVLAQAKALEAEGREIIHLEIGEPDFDTPPHISDAAAASLRAGETHYSPSAGLMDLREAVAEYISGTRKIPVSRNEVVITPGGKPVVFLLVLAVVEEGEEVIYPNPGYPAYESVVEFVGGKAVPIPLLEEKGFSFDVREMERRITPKTKLLILNSPQNPTGGVLPREDLVKIAELAKKHNLLVLSDEIYSRIIYDGEFLSIASLPGMKERTVILDGFSKTYAMTGWRLGYGVMPEDLAEKVTKLMNNANSCTCTFVQRAGIAALRGPQTEVEEMVQEFKRRRDFIVQGLNEVPGFSCTLPSGAFYVFPNVKGTGMPSRALASLLMEKAGVAALSGTAFGSFGEGYLRFSYANSIANIEKALKKIDGVLRGRK